MEITEHCKKCSGRGRIEEITTVPVDIPLSSKTGDVITVKSKGEMGGDLEVLLQVSPQYRGFTRRGNDLLYELTITLKEVC